MRFHATCDQDFQKFRNFMNYSLCCFRVFEENFVFEILTSFCDISLDSDKLENIPKIHRKLFRSGESSPAEALLKRN
ncbi:hypothetical protein T11_6367 [Trichinella zimbabwensis]|uniref:Uncharacterized protein n=1 Tax=Trichinella zimbabwensis TaxID=268475 RepID=A0A0V1GDU4_9BILA|nr:hypothetical protein T11_6367 [Trichinella zimbabwensis]